MNIIKEIKEIVCENLDIESEETKTDISFFELGGNSLTAYIVLEDIQEKFNVEISTEELFEKSTIEDIAALVDEKLKLQKSNDFSYI
ncbi:acyl carrier protein [Lacrimispora sp.]|uniref:acyl carrier protein n=1 Tax=Lacrimispora sp. TaxID=2719234 RepID=UPI0039934EFE